MNLANSSFLAQANLPFAYHQPNYVAGSQKNIDLLGLSQADLLTNQLNIYSLAQNPNALRNLGVLQQNESPELLFPSYQSRKYSQDQIIELLGLSQQTSNDLFASRLPMQSLSNLMLGGGDDPYAHLSQLGLERGLTPNSNNQLNSMRYLLETKDIKAQSQKNLNDLLLMQMNKTGSLNMNNSGYSLPPQFQNSTNLGGLLQNQSYLLNQNKPERPSRDLYQQNLELYEAEALNRQQLENFNILYQRQLKEVQSAGLSSQEYGNMLQMMQQQPKRKDESKNSQEKTQNPSQNKNGRRERFPSHDEKSLLSQVQSQKAKQLPIEITIQEDLEEEIPRKDSKEITHTDMVVENAMENVETSTTYSTEIQIEPIQKKLYQCFNRFCLTDKTNEALWAQEKVQNSTICKNCLDAYNKNRYCYFCHQIYHEDETAASNDDKEWIECEACKTWNHIDCETANNMKNLRLLIEKDNNYKYYCPNCKKNTQLESPSKNLKLPKSKPSSPPQTIAEQEQIKPAIQIKQQQPRTPLDESMLDEEGIKEPMIKKVRLLENTKVSIIQPQTQPNLMLNKEYQLQSDFAKSKLDKMFQKMQLKKKNPSRSFAVIDNSCYIEKLISQYGGRKIQLSEDEIKNDLSLFKDLGTRNGVMKEKKQEKNEGFSFKGAFSSSSLKSINKNQSLHAIKLEKDSKSRSQKSVWTNGKKAIDNIDDDEFSEQNLGEDFTENTIKGNNRSLRNRKRME